MKIADIGIINYWPTWKEGKHHLNFPFLVVRVHSENPDEHIHFEFGIFGISFTFALWAKEPPEFPLPPSPSQHAQ